MAQEQTDLSQRILDRYYTRKYKTAVKNETGSDFCILCHSNRLCVITIAPSHPILKEKKTPSSIDFQVDKRRNRLDSKANGKSKKGAQVISETGVICRVNCLDGTSYNMYSCIRGRLIEVNQNLIGNPALLTEKPSTDGYLGLILLNLEYYKEQVGKLLSSEQYLNEAGDATVNEPTV